MSMVFLSLESLAKIDDGVVAAMFKKAAEQVIKDCEDRPGEKKAREVELKMTITPVVDQEGNCDGLMSQFSCKSRIPLRHTTGIPLVIKAGGKAAFQVEDEMLEEAAGEAA